MKKSIHTHYDNLRIARDAPDEVIRAAYKVLSQKYHPDKNPRPDASRVMAILNNSYAVLSDNHQRRKHDEWIAEQEKAASPPRSAPPRRERSEQAERSRPRARPDTRPPKPSPAPAAPVWQTWNTDLTLGRIVVALCGVLVTAVFVFLLLHEKPVLTPLPLPAEIAASRRQAANEKNDGATVVADAPVNMSKGLNAVVQARSQQDDALSADASPVDTAKFRFSLDPDGNPWPLGPKIYRDDGLRRIGQSTITIDNSHNTHAVYIKLGIAPRLDEVTSELYIPGRRLVALENLPAGVYRLKYRDLQTGLTMQSQPVLLQDIRTEPPAQYGVLGITLYASPHDNVDFHQIGESEF